MRKYSINIDFGDDGYKTTGNLLKVIKFIREFSNKAKVTIEEQR